jgi:hypothetical protein
MVVIRVVYVNADCVGVVKDSVCLGLLLKSNPKSVLSFELCEIQSI